MFVINFNGISGKIKFWGFVIGCLYIFILLFGVLLVIVLWVWFIFVD